MPSGRTSRCIGSGRGANSAQRARGGGGIDCMAGDKFSWRKAFVSLMGATVLLVGVPALTVSAAGVDDFPYRGTVNKLDPWGFYTGYCTSFVAFRLSQEGVRLHGASLQGPNGKTAFFGNGGSSDAAAGGN